MTDQVSGEPPFVSAADLVALTGGDKALIDEIVQVFREDSARMMADLTAAVEAGDAGAAMRASHTLAGALTVFGLSPVLDSARAIESLAREGQLDGVQPRVIGLGLMVDRLNGELLRMFE